MHQIRVFASTTTLPDGRILIVGGGNPPFAGDIYDPTTGAWSAATLSESRSQYTVGAAGTQVLFAGGEGCIKRQENVSPETAGCAEIGTRPTVDIYDSAAGG